MHCDEMDITCCYLDFEKLIVFVRYDTILYGIALCTLVTATGTGSQHVRPNGQKINKKYNIKLNYNINQRSKVGKESPVCAKTDGGNDFWKSKF